MRGAWLPGVFNMDVVVTILEEASRSSAAADRAWLLYVLELWAQRWM